MPIDSYNTGPTPDPNPSPEPKILCIPCYRYQPLSAYLPAGRCPKCRRLSFRAMVIFRRAKILDLLEQP